MRILLGMFFPLLPAGGLGLIVFGPLWWLSCIAVGSVLLILAFFALFFGPSLALYHLFWEVSAEAIPLGPPVALGCRNC